MHLRLKDCLLVCVAAAMMMPPALRVSGAEDAGGKGTSKGAGSATSRRNADWATYNGSPDNLHYSTLKQINSANVAQLKPVWSYDTQETGGLQTQPLIVGGVLFGYTPHQKVFALNAATGKLLWTFNSGEGVARPERGAAYWTDGKDKRLLAGISHFVYALETATGKPIESFGDKGRIDLRENLRGDAKTLSVTITSPVSIYKDLLIVGDAEPESLPAPPGDIRAYDVRTGKVRWIFHTIPHPGEFGYDTWPKDAWKTSGAATTGAGWPWTPRAA